MKKPPNIIDVANLAKVSPSTVSSYFNKTTNIKQDKVLRIEKAVKELGYRQNIIAVGLRKGRVRIIGVIVPDINNIFYTAMIKGMETVGQKYNYSLIIASNNYNESLKKKQISDLLSSSISGFIFTSGGFSVEDIKKVQNNGIFAVAIDRRIKDDDIASIEVDNFIAVYKGINLLISKGHRNIYYFSEPITNYSLKERFEGYKRALIENNIEFNESKVILREKCKVEKTRGGYEIFKDIANSIELPAAIFTTSDFISYGAMRAAMEKGLKIPQDISFLGYDNVYLSEYTNPPLTTIKQPKKEMGIVGMEMLINLINKKKISSRKVLLNTEIIERETVFNLNKNF